MNRLTEKDDQGNCHLKGVRWEQLHEGQVVTGELREKLYGALWKLMEYEDTGVDPEDDVLVLVTVSGIYNALTFANAIQIGAYDRDRWFIEGYEDWNNPNVTAWMPLPEIYTSPGAGQAFRLAGADDRSVFG